MLSFIVLFLLVILIWRVCDYIFVMVLCIFFGLKFLIIFVILELGFLLFFLFGIIKFGIIVVDCLLLDVIDVFVGKYEKELYEVSFYVFIVIIVKIKLGNVRICDMKYIELLVVLWSLYVYILDFIICCGRFVYRYSNNF